MILSDIIGVIIGNIKGNNKIGKIKDLFLAYIENAETKLPHIDKLNVGINIPKIIKLRTWRKLKFSIKGAEIKKLNKNNTSSTKHNNKKQNIVLLKRSMLEETGEEISPPSVPESFSLTNNFAMMNISVKKIIIQFSIIKISNGIFWYWVPKL